MRSGFKLDPPHTAGCFLDGKQEFIVYDGWENRDRRGRKYVDGRGDWWYRFRCNDPSCDARLLVRLETLMDFLKAGAEN